MIVKSTHISRVNELVVIITNGEVIQGVTVEWNLFVYTVLCQDYIHNFI